MKSYNELQDLINELKNLFVYKKEILTYNQQTHEKARLLLDRIASITKTYDNTIKNESSNIRDELTIIDSSTGEKINLIDIESMGNRVKNLLDDNNMFSCLKALALSNKCAHSFDGELESSREFFIYYYNKLYPNELSGNEIISFMEPINNKFPKIIVNSTKYNINNLDDNKFEKLFKLLSSKKPNLKKEAKISVLRQFNISYNPDDNNDINKKFLEVVRDKDEILKAYLTKKYNEANDMVNMQNKLFAVKDEYISMIGQLLKTKEFKDVKYELVKTSDATSGFDYMLIIDDKELTYYIEVHMPNVLALSLIREYGLVESRARVTQRLGASAVYKRDKTEVENIYGALNQGSIPTGVRRAKVIARGYDPASSFEISHDADTSYLFSTKKINTRSNKFEDFLIHKNIFQNEVQNIKNILSNENFPYYILNKIVCDKYYSIYNSLNDISKADFIIYSIQNNKGGDFFDNYLCEFIEKNLNNYDKDEFAKMLIYKDKIKKEFLIKNKKIITDILNDKSNNKTSKRNIINNELKLLFDEYILEYINKEEYKDGNENEPRFKR